MVQPIRRSLGARATARPMRCSPWKLPPGEEERGGLRFRVPLEAGSSATTSRVLAPASAETTGRDRLPAWSSVTTLRRRAGSGPRPGTSVQRGRPSADGGCPQALIPSSDRPREAALDEQPRIAFPRDRAKPTLRWPQRRPFQTPCALRHRGEADHAARLQARFRWPRCPGSRAAHARRSQAFLTGSMTLTKCERGPGRRRRRRRAGIPPASRRSRAPAHLPPAQTNSSPAGLRGGLVGGLDCRAGCSSPGRCQGA